VASALAVPPRLFDTEDYLRNSQKWRVIAFPVYATAYLVPVGFATEVKNRFRLLLICRSSIDLNSSNIQRDDANITIDSETDVCVNRRLTGIKQSSHYKST
jgi:hypothetical protein